MSTDKTISAESYEQRKEMPNKIGSDMNGHRIMTLEEAAAFLRLDQSTLRVRAANGTIPGAKISHKAWRFIEEDLTRWNTAGSFHTQTLSVVWSPSKPPRSSCIRYALATPEGAGITGFDTSGFERALFVALDTWYD